MAALTWRNVDAPQLDTRGIAQAGQNITQSFDRMGQMLMQREAALRAEATNKALAAGMANQDPEAIKALLAQGTGGLDGRVDELAYMQGLGGYLNQLVERSMNQEQLYKTQDGRVNAAGYGRLAQLAKEFEVAAPDRRAGIEQERAALLAEMQANNGGYAATDTWNSGIELGNKDQDQKLAVDEFGQRVWRDKADVADARARTGIAAQEAAGNARLRAMQIAAAERQIAIAALPDQMRNNAVAAAEAFVKNGVTDPAEAAQLFARGKFVNGLGTNAEREAVMGQFKDYMTQRTTATETELESSGNSNVPYFLQKNGIRAPSVNALKVDVGAVKAQSSVAQKALSNSYLAANPNLDVFQRVAGYEAGKKSFTFDQVVDRYASESDIMDPADTLKTMQQRYNLSNNELVALLENSGFKDGSFWGNEPSTEKDFFTGGTRMLDRRAKEYMEARDSGDITKSQVELGGKLAPFAAKEARLERLLAKAASERAVGSVSQNTLGSIDRLKRELRELSAAGRTK